MRGKGESDGGNIGLSRITPAYAGKSPHVRDWRTTKKDHPRLCGEKFEFYVDFVHDKGSPPPMRGKVYTVCVQKAPFRITPAYAGKSPCKRSLLQSVQDHPRLCGEKTKKIPKQRYFFHQPASFSFSLQYT